MSFLDKAKSLMFEDDKKADPKVKAAPAPLAPRVPVGAGTPIALGDTAGEGGSTIDVEAVKAKIEDAIHGAPEFAPMRAFLKHFDDLETVISDDAVRIKAAQKTSGIDPATLISSIKSFAPTLQGEVDKFERVFVGGAVTKLNQLNEDGHEVVKQIDELTAKLGDLSKQKAEIGEAIRSGDVALQKAKIDFQSLVGALTKQYTEFGAKLEQHLGA
jgi:hypothetical protein